MITSFSSSTQAFRIERKVDRLFPKLAELSALLCSGELAHSPAGWVTLNTLNAYTGRAVPGNFDPQSQTVVDSKPFTLTHQSTPLKLDDHLLQAIVAIDDKNRRRFQICQSLSQWTQRTGHTPHTPSAS